MEQQQFQQNISEWVITINSILKELREDVDDIAMAQEEDLQTLSFQHQVIKDLRKRVMRLERYIIFLKERNIKHGGIKHE